VPEVWKENDPSVTALCHIEEKKGLGGVTVKIYGATLYKDESCVRRPDKWRKFEISSVHCGTLGAIFHPSRCKRKVKERFSRSCASTPLTSRSWKTPVRTGAPTRSPDDTSIRLLRAPTTVERES
jgi:hypothetical protein